MATTSEKLRNIADAWERQDAERSAVERVYCIRQAATEGDLAAMIRSFREMQDISE